MKTQPLKGMRDLLPREQALRDYIQGQILDTYRAAGFQRISTPILEDMENLDKSDGGDNLNLIFKVLKRGEKLAAALRSGDEKQLSDMGLRYDLTLPLSRYYAANKDKLPSPAGILNARKKLAALPPGSMAAAKNPPHSSAVPHRAAHRGPRLSCRKPPRTHPTPNAAMRIPKA